MFLGFQDYIRFNHSRLQHDCCIFTHFPCIFQIPSYRPFLPQAQRLIGKMLYETSRLEYECWRCSFTVAGRCNLLKSVSFGFTPRPCLVYRVGHHDGLLTTDQPLVQHGSGSTNFATLGSTCLFWNNLLPSCQK